MWPFSVLLCMGIVRRHEFRSDLDPPPPLLGVPKKVWLCSHLAQIWATSNFLPVLSTGTPRRQGLCSHFAPTDDDTRPYVSICWGRFHVPEGYPKDAKGWLVRGRMFIDDMTMDIQQNIR